MVDEFSVTLIQSEPRLGVLVHTISHRVHLQLRQLQLLNELRAMFNSQVHVLVAFKPMPLPTLPHPLLGILCRHCAINHLAHQLAQDLAIDGLELVYGHQLAVIQRL